MVVLLQALAPSFLTAQDPEPAVQEPSLEALAMDWVGLVQREQSDSAAAQVAPAVAAQLDAEAIRSGWQQITGQFGALESLEPGTRSSQAGYDIVDLAGTFEEGTATVRVVFDGARKVAGFFVLPPGSGPSGP